MAEPQDLPFHPLVAQWFLGHYGAPTPVQVETWAKVAAGDHVLALAPTGSGKTLAAFLHALSGLASGKLPAGGLRVLYVSPLKALNEDIRRNLEIPLEGLSLAFKEAGLAFPALRAETRSGDTPQAQRRRFLSKPPAILCTTPESLAILLDSPRARPILAGVSLLILDEVHAVAGSKRGSLLASSVGRLALLAGEFQRVALSATLDPPDEVQAFVGGLTLARGPQGQQLYAPRPVTLVAPPMEKTVEFTVTWPEAGLPGLAGPGLVRGDVDPAASRYDAVIPAMAQRLKAARRIIIFTDSRRRAERIAFLLNESLGQGTAWAHHGSLAKEARLVVEERFKAGLIRCVVATASLELGIDIGEVDEVLLAGAPPEVAAALQRAGRSGHGVGGISRAILYPFHGMDVLRSAAVVMGAKARELEPLHLPRSPLDVLAQVLLSLCAEGEWPIQALYETVLTFPPFVGLERSLFDSSLAMLSGRYAIPGSGTGGGAGARLRELEPRVYVDAATATVRARDGVRALLNSAGGAIPDRGHFSLRVAGSGTRIGELDEEFVFERKVGEAFTLGAQSWRISSIGDEAVEVEPLGKSSDFIPFWKAEGRYRSSVVSRRLLCLLARMSALLAGKAQDRQGAEKDIRDLLAQEAGLDEAASRVATSFVAAQMAAMGDSAWALPGPGTMALEAYADPTRRAEAHCVILHSLRGGAINEVLGLALAAALEEEGGLAPEVISDDDFVLLILPAVEAGSGGVGDSAVRVAALLGRLGPRKRLEGLVRRRLEASGLFGAQFREAAGRALLIPRGIHGKRSPLWVTRLRAKRLFEAVRDRSDFPVTIETWRACLTDILDLEGAAELVEGVGSGQIRLGIFQTRTPSPFAKEAIWRETAEYMYQGDELRGSTRPAGGEDAIAAALRSSRLRPRLAESLLKDFSLRATRLLPGWGPGDPFEFAEWVKERVLIPVDEVADLLAAGEPGLGAALDADPGVGGRISTIVLPGAGLACLVHGELRNEVLAEPGAYLGEWLRHTGPIDLARIRTLFGLAEEDLAALLSELEEEGQVVVDEFRDGSDLVEAVDAENLEILLRLGRKARRPEVLPRPGRDLFPLLARLQGLRTTQAQKDPQGLGACLERLAGLGLPLRLLETEILPRRVTSYAPRLLDEALARGELVWYGTGQESVAFARPEELELFLEPGRSSSLVPSDAPPRDFWEIHGRQGGRTRDLALALWAEAWEARITSPGFEALRLGGRNGFGKDLPELEPESSGPSGAQGSAGGLAPGYHSPVLPQALKGRWRQGPPVAGGWYSLELPGAGPSDILDEGELDAARVKVLAKRHGLLCRLLLEREAPALRWSRLFPALRLLELRGELVYGRFFEGIEGPQFLSPEAWELWSGLGQGWEQAEGADGLWLNALDPVAPSLALQAQEAGLDWPSRLPGNHLGVVEGRLAATLVRSGKELRLAQGLDEGTLMALARGLKALRASTGKRIGLALVEGQRAADWARAPILLEAGFEADRGSLVLW